MNTLVLLTFFLLGNVTFGYVKAKKSSLDENIVKKGLAEHRTHKKDQNIKNEPVNVGDRSQEDESSEYADENGSLEHGSDKIKLGRESWTAKDYGDKPSVKESKIPIPPFGFGFEESEDDLDDDEDSFEDDGIYIRRPLLKPEIPKGKKGYKFGNKPAGGHGKVPYYSGPTEFDAGHKHIGREHTEKEADEHGRIEPKFIHGRFIPIRLPMGLDPRFGLYGFGLFPTFGRDPKLFYEFATKQSKLQDRQSKEHLKADKEKISKPDPEVELTAAFMDGKTAVIEQLDS